MMWFCLSVLWRMSCVVCLSDMHRVLAHIFCVLRSFATLGFLVTFSYAWNFSWCLQLYIPIALSWLVYILQLSISALSSCNVYMLTRAMLTTENVQCEIMLTRAMLNSKLIVVNLNFVVSERLRGGSCWWWSSRNFWPKTRVACIFCYGWTHLCQTHCPGTATLYFHAISSNFYRACNN